MALKHSFFFVFQLAISASEWGRNAAQELSNAAFGKAVK